MAVIRCRRASKLIRRFSVSTALSPIRLPEWLKENVGKGFRLGFDPWLHTISEVEALSAALAENEAELVAVDNNPIDELWAGRPEAPLQPVEIHPIEFAGELAKHKLERLAADIARQGATHAVLTDPSSIAWAFNIRGRDVPHTPLALAFAILGADGKHTMFIDKRKLPITPEAYLTQLSDLHPPSALEPDLIALAKNRRAHRA